MFSNSRGSALIYVVIAGALIALLIPTLSSLLIHATDRTQARQRLAEYVSLVRSVKEQVDDPILCSNQVLGGQSIDPTAGPPFGSLVELKLAYGQNAPPVIKAGWKTETASLEIFDVRLILKGVLRPSVMLDAPLPPMISYEADILIRPNNISINFEEGLGKSLRIPVIVNLNGPVVVGCFGATSVAAHCQAMGGAYDTRPANGATRVNPYYRCNPDGHHCFSGGQGVVTRRNACALPFTAEQVGFAKVPQFLCSWCNDRIQNYTPYP